MSTTNEERALLITVAEKLSAHRQAAGLSQAQLSELSGVSVGSIQRIERAEGNPSLKTISQLAAALGLIVKLDLVSLK